MRFEARGGVSRATRTQSGDGRNGGRSAPKRETVTHGRCKSGPRAFLIFTAEQVGDAGATTSSRRGSCMQEVRHAQRPVTPDIVRVRREMHPHIFDIKAGGPRWPAWVRPAARVTRKAGDPRRTAKGKPCSAMPGVCLPGVAGLSLHTTTERGESWQGLESTSRWLWRRRRSSSSGMRASGG